MAGFDYSKILDFHKVINHSRSWRILHCYFFLVLVLSYLCYFFSPEKKTYFQDFFLTMLCLIIPILLARPLGCVVAWFRILIKIGFGKKIKIINNFLSKINYKIDYDLIKKELEFLLIMKKKDLDIDERKYQQYSINSTKKERQYFHLVKNENYKCGPKCQPFMSHLFNQRLIWGDDYSDLPFLFEEVEIALHWIPNEWFK